MKTSPRLLVLVSLALLGPACVADEPGDPEPPAAAFGQASAELGVSLLSVDREPLAGNLAHYRIRITLGDTPNASIGLHRLVRERGPWQPERSTRALMLLHGDFSSFDTNFALPAAPEGGLAPFLAAAGVDVWGLDRRWTGAPAGGDLSDFGAMGFAQALDDTRVALGFARLVRAATGSGAGPMLLGGFSRGAQLTYAFAAEEATSNGPKQVSGIVPIDIYATLDPADQALRDAACARRDAQREQLAAGQLDSDNTSFPFLVQLATDAPDEPSPVFEGLTNHQALLLFGAQTFLFFDVTPVYHLVGGELGDFGPTGLRYTAESVFGAWLAAAVPHQALAEITDGDALWCGEGELPPGENVGAITVPVLHIGAAGGFGDHAAYTLGLVSSTDETFHVVRRLTADLELEDYGHADLLYADDAPQEVWDSLASWVLAH